MRDFIGLGWIAEHSGIAPVQPFSVKSRIGTARRTVVTGTTRLETYPAQLRPEPSIAAHLTFAFKHEILHLEFLSRFFDVMDPAILEHWCRAEPTGGYARRAGFFYEWLTGLRLQVPDVGAGNYVDALDPAHYMVASHATNVRRWRVRDNLPGTRDFCPLVARTEKVLEVERYDCAKALNALEAEFGADVLLRSAVWLTIKESRASFAIEHEAQDANRIHRFAAAMEQRCGQDGNPLTLDALTTLQTHILGNATRYGVRKSPVFVGHNASFTNVIDYIAPHWDQTQPLLTGLQAALARTVGAASILRAAIASFGFVFIHPMADGNGRISRFLVNDVLRRDGAVPAPFILPISSTITNSSRERVGYDHALEHFSKPLMQRYGDQACFGAARPHEDGVQSDFWFDAYDDALPVWRYPDLTFQSEYLGHVVRVTIEEEMSREAMFLRNIERAREGVKNWLEGPNTDIDRIIRAIQNSGWKVSNNLRKQFPQLNDEQLAGHIVRAVQAALDPAEHASDENAPGEPEKPSR